MPGLATGLPLAAAAAFVVWTLLSAYVLTSRLLHDARSRRIRATRRRLERSGLESLPPRRRLLHASRILSEASRRVVTRIAADRNTPPGLAEALAVHALGRWGAAPLLRDAARHRGEGGRWRRIAALRLLTKAAHPRSLRLLQAALRSGDATVVDAAVGLIGSVPDRRAGEALLRAIEQRLYSPSRIATALERFPVDIGDLLMPRLRHADQVVRYWAAVLLERFPFAPGLGPRLASLGGDPDASVRKAAVDTLSRLGAPEAVPTALALLDDPVLFVRAHAARALGELRRADLAASLLPLLADREWWVRLAAKQALEAMGRPAAAALESALDHPDRFARNGAAEVLQNLGVLDDLARGVLAGARGTDEARLRRAVQAGGRPLLEMLAARANDGAERLDAVLATGLLEAS